VGVVLLTAALGSAGSVVTAAPAKVSVVAAEDFWGSIARQLGGDHAEVKSIIADPDTGDYEYEATPQDAAGRAGA